MDVGGGKPYPEGALSNFCSREFVFDGVRCGSMEGLLQSWKYQNPLEQEEVCGLVGFAAKARGPIMDEAWQSDQTLWWKGKACRRDSEEYQKLLDRAYEALTAQSEKFRNALLATGKHRLTHSIGKQRKEETVLTEAEFCSRLMRIRERLQDEANGRPGQ
jgi:hypothetical protein